MNKFSLKLGEDQIKWKNRFGSIDINQWRLEKLYQNKSEWVYIGDWEPDHSNLNASYLERKDNILRNKYHYWPKNT